MPDPPSYRVWAPSASGVTLHLETGREEMIGNSHGWWTAARTPRDGELYGYLVDGEGPFPDPRSQFQPLGVHGLSEWIDHRRFKWTDARWQAPPLAAGVLYELHIGTFSEDGTFAGAMGKLAELVDLGVTHIELMPVAEFSGHRGWGYDGVDLFAPHHAYGRPDDLKALVDACHGHGLAVLLDVVYNHFGPSGNYLSKFAPYFTSRYSTPWGDGVNLDGARSHEVRRFFCDNAAMWLRDYHMDGLRIDAVHALVDSSAVHFLEQLAGEVETLEATLGRHLVLIAESDLNDPRIVTEREAGGFGLDAQWSDDFHHALHAVMTGEQSGYYEDFGTLAHLAKALTNVFVYAGTHSRFRRRVHGRSAGNLPGWRFVVHAQNHDQTGNRAQGERLGHLTSPERLKIAAALLLCSPFVPMLFQGEEWGASTPFCYFTAHEEELLGQQVFEGRRKEFAAFGWAPSAIPDPQAIDTFHRSRLRWDERQRGPHRELLDWHRQLIALRRETPDLRDGNYQALRVTLGTAGDQFIVQRGEILIACNLSRHSSSVAAETAVEVLLTSNSSAQLVNGLLDLPPESVAIVRTSPVDQR